MVQWTRESCRKEAHRELDKEDVPRSQERRRGKHDVEGNYGVSEEGVV